MSDTKPGIVLLHYGSMDMDTMNKIQKLLGKDAVIDVGAARLSGASFAMGSDEHLAELSSRLVPHAKETARAEFPSLSNEAINWLANGNRGNSSEAIFYRLTGMTPEDPRKYGAYPFDVDDLKRCRKLLEQVPELADRIDEMSEVSPQWASIAENWTRLCDLMDSEAPRWRESFGSAPETNKLLRTLRVNAQKQPQNEGE